MLNLIYCLQQKGISDINVIIPAEGGVCNELKKLNIKFYVIPFVNESYDYRKPPSHLKMLAKKYYNLFLVAKHKHHFKKNRNLLIHTNSSVTFFGAYLAQSLRVPHVWHIREFGKPDYNFIYNFGESYFFKWVNKASAVIFISNALFNYRMKKKIKPMYEIIYNGVISENAITDTINPKPKNQIFRFGISGHISEAKNQADAIKACKLVNESFDCELWIAGTGDEDFIKELQLLITSLTIGERVKFIGFIDDIAAFYDSVDCVLMCAKSEALGRVTIEAMSKGLPVIGFNNAGTCEIIKDDFNGLLYNNDYTQLAEKMKAVINNYEALKPIREHALETVKENFTIEKYTASVMEVYNEISGA
ncbi:MAG: glycosyltransferase family 4 protein [Parafilimonas sp.]|nr:glycosyltransferase family 4 protein [Parafilimonas sp.]